MRHSATRILFYTWVTVLMGSKVASKSSDTIWEHFEPAFDPINTLTHVWFVVELVGCINPFYGQATTNQLVLPVTVRQNSGWTIYPSFTIRISHAHPCCGRPKADGAKSASEWERRCRRRRRITQLQFNDVNDSSFLLPPLPGSVPRRRLRAGGRARLAASFWRLCCSKGANGRAFQASLFFLPSCGWKQWNNLASYRTSVES